MFFISKGFNCFQEARHLFVCFLPSIRFSLSVRSFVCSFRCWFDLFYIPPLFLSSSFLPFVLFFMSLYVFLRLHRIDGDILDHLNISWVDNQISSVGLSITSVCALLAVSIYI